MGWVFSRDDVVKTYPLANASCDLRCSVIKPSGRGWQDVSAALRTGQERQEPHVLGARRIVAYRRGLAAAERRFPRGVASGRRTGRGQAGPAFATRRGKRRSA